MGPGGILKPKPSAKGRQRTLFVHRDALKQIVEDTAEWDGGLSSKKRTIVEIKRAQKVRDAARAKASWEDEEPPKARLQTGRLGQHVIQFGEGFVSELAKERVADWNAKKY